MKKQVNRVKALQVVMTGEAHETEIPDNLFELFKEIDYENDLKDAEHDINIYILEETEEGYIALISIDSQYLGEVNKYTKKYFTKIESTKSDNTLAQLLGRGMRRYPGKERPPSCRTDSASARPLPDEGGLLISSARKAFTPDGL